MKRALLALSGACVASVASWVVVEHVRSAVPLAPQVGTSGLIINDDPTNDFVVGYNPKWRYGMDVIPVGTRAVLLGGGERQKDLKGDLIKVSLESGAHSGEPCSILPTHWRPVPAR